MRLRAVATSVAFTLVATTCVAPAALAQSAPASAPDTGYQDGFFVQTADGDYRLVFGAIAQLDGRFALDDPKPIINTFTLRKMRPTLSGRIAKYFDFKLMPDFGNGTAVVQDAYFEIRFSPKFRVRTGKEKTPVGHELLIGDPFLLFPERSLASSLVPNRDLGVSMQGDLSPKVSYAAGVYNGIPDGSSSTTELDTNSAKDLAGRVVVQLFRSTAAPSRRLNGLGVQVGFSTGHEAGALPSFKTSVGQTYFSYLNATANGERHRIAPAIFYYYKAFGAFGEYIQSTQAIGRARAITDVTNSAWDVTGSFVLTGEAASDRGVRPRNHFDPQTGQWGALQLMARYSELKIDEAAFSAGLAAAGSSSGASSFSVGLDWYPNAQFKYYATFERTTFEREVGTVRPSEHVMLVRAQLAF